MDCLSKKKLLRVLLFALSTLTIFSFTSGRYLGKIDTTPHETKENYNCSKTLQDHQAKCRNEMNLCEKQAGLSKAKPTIQPETSLSGSRHGKKLFKSNKTEHGANDHKKKCRDEMSKCEMQGKVAKGKL